MAWTIEYHTPAVEKFVLNLPDGLLAAYLRLTELMLVHGPDLGMPHTRAMGGGLLELRVSGQEGNARVFFCTRIGQRVVMLDGYVKKTQRTPPAELKRAKRLLAEAKSR